MGPPLIATPDVDARGRAISPHPINMGADIIGDRARSSANLRGCTPPREVLRRRPDDHDGGDDLHTEPVAAARVLVRQDRAMISSGAAGTSTE